MQLRDDKSRTVLVKVVTGQGNIDVTFWAKDGLTLDRVSEAQIVQGDDVFLDMPYIVQELANTGVRAATVVEPTVEKGLFGRYSSISVPMTWDWQGGWSAMGGANGKREYKINGIRVPEADFQKVSELVAEMNQFNGLGYWDAHLATKCSLPYRTVLELVGEGKTVTPESLAKGCAKGEGRARLLPGDTVEVDVKGGKFTGTVKGMASKVSVLKQDGTKGTYPYEKVVRAAGASYNDSIVGELEDTLKANFDFLKAQANRVYRAKLERCDLSFPMFPDEENQERVISVKDAPSCYCPLCGWKMANFQAQYGNEFQCSYCKVRGLILDQTEEEVSLLMLRMPAKNRFAIKECRCCANCGLFQFEYGRQGKRTTGYCQAANQCVQAFNTCDVWFPRDPKAYEQNIKQHTTNLGYGVADTRNTSRNDIRDTVYRAEDHEAERKRAERVRIVYEQAYIKAMEELKELAKNALLYSGPLDEEGVKVWQEVLDDPC